MRSKECKFQTSQKTTRSKQRVYNAERRNHTEPNCSHLPRTHPAQVRRAHMSTSLHRVRSYLYTRAITCTSQTSGKHWFVVCFLFFELTPYAHYACILKACTRVRSYLYQRAILHSSGKGQFKEQQTSSIYRRKYIRSSRTLMYIYTYIYIHIRETYRSMLSGIWFT